MPCNTSNHGNRWKASLAFSIHLAKTIQGGGGLQAPEKLEGEFIGEKHGGGHGESSDCIHCGPAEEHLQREGWRTIRSCRYCALIECSSNDKVISGLHYWCALLSYLKSSVTCQANTSKQTLNFHRGIFYIISFRYLIVCVLFNVALEAFFPSDKHRLSIIN